MLLLERIIHRLRKMTIKEKDSLESQLAEMASDREIQRELQTIDKEFSVVESDGIIPNRSHFFCFFNMVIPDVPRPRIEPYPN